MKNSFNNPSKMTSYSFIWKDPLSYMPIIISALLICVVIYLYLDKDIDQNTTNDITIGFLLLSLLLITISFVRIRRVRKLLIYGQSTKAIVDYFGYDQSYNRTSNTIKYHYDVNGKTYKKKEACLSGNFQKGEVVTIVYNPKNPQKAILAEKLQKMNKKLSITNKQRF